MREEDEELELCRPWTVGLQFTQHNAACPESGHRALDQKLGSKFVVQKQDGNVTAAMLLRSGQKKGLIQPHGPKWRW